MSNISNLENKIFNAQGGGHPLSFVLAPCATNNSIFSESITITPLWVVRRQERVEIEKKRQVEEERRRLAEEERRQKQEAEELRLRLLAEERQRRGTAEPIDLGLSVMWAAHNIGARSCEQQGVYASWLQKDEALSLWGEDWRLPTQQEMLELMQTCQWAWTINNGMPGFQVTSLNGNHIFLPAGGSCVAQQYDSYGVAGRYWCDTSDTQYVERAMYLEFNQYSGNLFSIAKMMQMTIRPVKERH
ncbi:MAG: hypothetical protein PUH68_05060 [Bacteroidales bacterium]|nr:hypothetical protein [Bacteroidales bacterium]